MSTSSFISQGEKLNSREVERPPYPTQRVGSRHGVRVPTKCSALSMPAASHFLPDVIREECAEEAVTTLSFFPEHWDSSGNDGDR